MNRRLFMLALLAPMLPALQVSRIQYRAVMTREQARVVFEGLDLSHDGDRMVTFCMLKDGLWYVADYVMPQLTK